MTAHQSHTALGSHVCECILDEDHHQEELDELSNEDRD